MHVTKITNFLHHSVTCLSNSPNNQNAMHFTDMTEDCLCLWSYWLWKNYSVGRVSLLQGKCILMKHAKFKPLLSMPLKECTLLGIKTTLELLAAQFLICLSFLQVLLAYYHQKIGYLSQWEILSTFHYWAIHEMFFLFLFFKANIWNLWALYTIT